MRSDFTLFQQMTSFPSGQSEELLAAAVVSFHRRTSLCSTAIKNNHRHQPRRTFFYLFAFHLSWQESVRLSGSEPSLILQFWKGGFQTPSERRPVSVSQKDTHTLM